MYLIFIQYPLSRLLNNTMHFLSNTCKINKNGGGVRPPLNLGAIYNNPIVKSRGNYN